MKKLIYWEKFFGPCSFQNYAFNHFNAKKGKFSSCQFEDYKITNSDMTRAEFYNTNFKTCEFLSVDLGANNFDCATVYVLHVEINITNP